ncbi:MAG TPA: nucleotidyltransferase family protein [Thermoanaerobaculia bacterium]|nr:nucleotidyltransferase family protein [Thermoanaerobaculia bacterium]
MKIAAVVPASGLSRRMGREKVLLPFRGATILETILESLAAAGVSERVAVVRPDLSEAADRARRRGAVVVTNPHPEGEMIVSIRLGLGALSPETDAVFVWPADHPAVSASTLTLLAAVADPTRALIPTYLERRGHPAIIGKALLPDIALIPPNEGLRALYRKRRDSVVEIPMKDPGVVKNIDTPADYEELLGEDSRH